MDSLTITYTIVATILSVMLIISELLAWSDCKANAITQLHRCLRCRSIEEPKPQVGETWSV